MGGLLAKGGGGISPFLSLRDHPDEAKAESVGEAIRNFIPFTYREIQSGGGLENAG